jgi:hypothetical protein
MIDHNVAAAARHFDSEEEANARACYATAARNGHTVERADQCDDGDVECPDCPFRRKLLPPRQSQEPTR